MTINRNIHVAVATLLLACTTLQSARAEEKELEPNILLFGFPGSDRVEQYPVDPLLLHVVLKNDAFERVSQNNDENRELLDRFRNQKGYDELSDTLKSEFLERHEIEPLPSFRLGSDSQPISTLVKFRVIDDKGEEHSVEARSLAANKKLGQQVELSNDQPTTLFYVIEPEQFRALEKGDYVVKASLDTSKNMGMWQGHIESTELSLKLGGNLDQGSEQQARLRLYATGSYYLKDEQFEKALTNSETLISSYPEYVGGWMQKGDALDGLEKKEQALETFRKARSLYYANQEKQDYLIKEPPDYIDRRLFELGSVLNEASGSK